MLIGNVCSAEPLGRRGAETAVGARAALGRQGAALGRGSARIHLRAAGAIPAGIPQRGNQSGLTHSTAI